jgi:hypothetical protein
MTQELGFLFFGWCLTSLLVNGSIFDSTRNYLIVMYPFFGKLFSCIQCTGVWVGILIFWPLIYFSDVNLLLGNSDVKYLIYPVIQSGYGVLLESFVIMMVKNNKGK